ncbi:MAG TPA: spermidine synthase [Nitrospiraceae bacterium]|nr:spermidine synthase [Nitrospiraceae bacterium]
MNAIMSDKKHASESFIIGLTYLMFFLSGAAALVYQVVWVRSLILIFGGTHLAVTTVLSVFMGGLALGSYFIGRRVDTMKRPLQFYGMLELGIAVSAMLFIVLLKVYPSVYIFLARGGETSRLYLTVLRVFVTFLALIVPTTLMGGTLPVLVRFVSGQFRKVDTKLSLLYGFNTLGAVAGTASAAFVLLRFYSVSTALNTAIILNVIIGIVCIALQRRVSAIITPPDTGAADTEGAALQPSAGLDAESPEMVNPFSLRLVLLGIGVSGFCALGYEVLWTRILTLTIGTSVYGFSIMLIAFLTGIALGSKSYGIFRTIFRLNKKGLPYTVAGFGIVQFIIGIAALVVTLHLRDLPVHATTLKYFYSAMGLDAFNARQWADLTLAFSYMIVPSFFMGLAFPFAGTVNAYHKKRVGHAVGDVLAYNTVGAILGSAISGYVLIFVFGIERSLQLLTIINMGFGLLVMFSIRNTRVVNWGIAGLTAGALLFLMINQDVLRMWDMRFFAIFQNNKPEAYDTPYKKRDAIENTEILFYREGTDSTISSINVKGMAQAVLVNGKTVASSSLEDRQCQLTLGHLPMLLHRDPRKVLVIGLGTGMTLGAVSIHPEVEELIAAEIEPNVTGATRTFGKYNNYVLDNPKLKIIFNDGRNYLLMTKRKFDVITADPIHPWTQGSGYLYTAEYFKLASERLAPGGIMGQWLPIYELSVDDLKSVLITFSQSFKYTMTWVTAYDAELVGSNSPIIIDEAELQRRISFPPILRDLKPVMMGSSTDFLSYFVMATDQMRAFSKGGIINTDDNLYLEYSAPKSQGQETKGSNFAALVQYREGILPYLLPPMDGMKRQEQVKRWEGNLEAARITDQLRALFFGVDINNPQYQHLLTELDAKYRLYAPARFIKEQFRNEAATIPYLLEDTSVTLLDEKGGRVVKVISAVVARVSDIRASLVFVDNDEKIIYGSTYFDGPDLEKTISRFVNEVLTTIDDTYRAEAERALGEGKEFPPLNPTMDKIRNIVQTKCGTPQDS